ncbi:MAG: tetratricopeptide repeat protein [Acidobacteriota bacterium]
MKTSPARCLFSVIFFLIMCTSALAQNRAIEGRVTDDNGEALEGVKITITGVDNPRRLETKTDKDGKYIYLLGLQPGTFRVVARKEGFQPMKEENVKSEMGESIEVDFELTPGPDHKFPFEMTDEEREEYMKQYEEQKKYQKYSAAVKEHFEKGVDLYNANNYDEAIVEFNAALELDPSQPAIHSRLADSYKKLEKYEDALAAYDKVIELDPTNSNAYTNKGDVLNKLGKEKESLEAFQKATEMNPNAGAQNFYNMGVTHYNNGDLDQASAFFRKAIESDKNYAEAYYLLATCLSSNMDTIPEAITLFQQYIDLGGKAENVEIAKQMVDALKDYAN